ncbi:MAG: ATP-grasp domain-containing protein [Bacteroidales bacterium]|nr:ATP-grasp domain-containing protein [Bacteroidales bacterium]MDD2612909.1 ATP-grasp domain-containing protein [Bacteroidales bacterium]MDD3907371.1 ATP-grasp domain-containing protein [Bacteroidales bacterium]
MKKEINILFLGGAKRVSLAEHFISYGKEIGFEINIFSYELDIKVPISLVGKAIVGLKWKDPNLYQDLGSVIKENKINIVLPFVDSAVEVASKMRALYPDVFIPCSDVKSCKTMFDKKLASEWFYHSGIEQPRTYKNGEVCTFPVILKPREGSASKGIQVIDNLEGYEKVRDIDNYLIQEYIADNTEFTVDCYVSSAGHIFSIVPRVRLETAGGEVVRSQTVRDETLITLSEKILSTGFFRGPVTIQFIKDNRTGKVYVMEINPRLGGGVIASIGAGSGMLSFIIGEYLRNELKPVLTWKEGVLMTRYFKEVIFYADNH